MFIYFVKFELKGSFQYSACLDGHQLLTQVAGWSLEISSRKSIVY